MYNLSDADGAASSAAAAALAAASAGSSSEEPQLALPTFAAGPTANYYYPQQQQAQQYHDAASYSNAQGLVKNTYTYQSVLDPRYSVISDGGGSNAAKRKQVKNACVNCQKACKKCDNGRPCPRCVRYGLQATCHDSVRKERRKGVKRGPYKHKSYRVTVSPDRASSQVRDTSSYDDQAIEKRQRSASTATTPELDPQPAEMAEETPEPAKGSAEADAAAAAAAWSKLHILSQLCSAVLDHSTKTDDGEGETEPETEAVDGTSKAAVTSTVPAPLSTEDDEVPIVKPRAVRPKSARVSKKRSAEGSPKEKAAKKQARGDGVVAETEDMDDGAEVTTNVSHIVSPTSSGSSHKVGEQPVPKGVVTRRALAGSAATIPTTTPAPSPSRGPHRDQLNGDHLQKKVMEAGMAAGVASTSARSNLISPDASPTRKITSSK